MVIKSSHSVLGMMIVVVELLINFLCICHITLWMIVSNEQGMRFCEISSVQCSWPLLGQVFDR